MIPKKIYKSKQKFKNEDSIIGGPTAPGLSEPPISTAPIFIKDVSDLKVGEIYSVTLNPNDRYQYWDHEKRFEMFCKWLLKIMHGLRSHVELDLHTEISLKGRLHAHGKIVFKDVYNFYLKDFNMLIGMCNIDIDTINNQDIWDTYVSKQQDASTYKHYTLDDTSFKICPIDKTKFKVTKYIKTCLDDHIQIEEEND